MAYMVTAECVSCAACEFECPVRAITQTVQPIRHRPLRLYRVRGLLPGPALHLGVPGGGLRAGAARLPGAGGVAGGPGQRPHPRHAGRSGRCAGRSGGPTLSDALSPEEAADLRARLKRLEQQQAWVTNKETLKRVQREAAELQWRLGLIGDDEYAALEDFTENFGFEA